MYSTKTCAYCNNRVPLGRGIMYVKNDGSVQWFCSSKCRKAVMKLKRDPRRARWVSRRIRSGERR